MDVSGRFSFQSDATRVIIIFDAYIPIKNAHKKQDLFLSTFFSGFIFSESDFLNDILLVDKSHLWQMVKKSQKRDRLVVRNPWNLNVESLTSEKHCTNISRWKNMCGWCLLDHLFRAVPKLWLQRGCNLKNMYARSITLKKNSHNQI